MTARDDTPAWVRVCDHAGCVITGPHHHGTARAATEPGLARLAKEIRDVHASLRDGLTMRRDHPAYTKASLDQQRARLGGLITGHMIASGAWLMSGDPSADTLTYARDQYGIDLAALWQAIKES